MITLLWIDDFTTYWNEGLWSFSFLVSSGDGRLCWKEYYTLTFWIQMSFDVLRRRSLSFVSGSTHITSLCVLHKFLLQILQSLFLNILWRWENLAEVWLEAAEWMCQTVSLGKFGASLVWTSRPSEEHIKKCWQRWEREFPLSSPSGPPANLHGPPLISPGHLYLLSWVPSHGGTPGASCFCYLSQEVFMPLCFRWKTLLVIALKQGLSSQCPQPKLFGMSYHGSIERLHV